MDSSKRYSDGWYLADHPDWHAKDGPGKAQDVLRGVSIAVAELRARSVSIADIGCGTGSVLNSLLPLLRRRFPSTSLKGVGYEPAAPAWRLARELFPALEMRNRPFDADPDEFDIALLVDVLEHLENPSEMLRFVNRTCRYVVVRQPLIDSFGTFRHRAYREQRDRLGHIGYWNVRSFDDLMAACGWVPLSPELVAPWDLHAPTVAGASVLHRVLVRALPELSSVVMSGFYRVGAYTRADPEALRAT